MVAISRGSIWGQSAWTALCKGNRRTVVGNARSHLQEAGGTSKAASASGEALSKETLEEARLFHRYRRSGHLEASLNPLQPNGSPLGGTKELGLGLDWAATAKDLPEGVRAELTKKEALLREAYSGAVGYEIDHIECERERAFLYGLIESCHHEGRGASPSAEQQEAAAVKLAICRRLIQSDALDTIMSKRYGQVKRYGMEGGEGMLIAIDAIIDAAKGGKAEGGSHIVIGMPHRGRLNLLYGALGMPAEVIFSKLTGANELSSPAPFYTGDVLSHLSYTGPVDGEGGSKTRITLLPNSSHLEAVNPVQMGVVYGLQHFDRKQGPTKGRAATVSVQVHGDAAFNGQGVVQETLQMSGLAGFSVGGTIHIIVNNQVGYTATAAEGRPTRYASSPAKMIEAPIIHVNGNDPVATWRAAQIAQMYCEAFGKDVLLDIICYRRNGHNELDEPSFTQPLMYASIKGMPSLCRSFTDSLIKEGLVDEKTCEDIRRAEMDRLDRAIQAAKGGPSKVTTPTGIQSSLEAPKQIRDIVWGREALVEGALQSVTLPSTFRVHGRLQKFHIDARKAALKEALAARGARKIDWATAEAMAVSTLLSNGINVRLVGQDVERGTFSQRHFTFWDQEDGTTCKPLCTGAQSSEGEATEGRGKLQVVNSLLSEYAVTAFEYGSSLVDPYGTLHIWEAQFGDFFNGAQIVFDAFLSGGESKWSLVSPLTILLPHGYDGAGPEHSSCRLERFLQMSNDPLPHGRAKFDGADERFINWRIINPTTPANYFGALIGQMSGPLRKPLIVASPKTLLRHPQATSSLDDLVPQAAPSSTRGREPSGARQPGRVFMPVLGDPLFEGNADGGAQADCIVFCSGKIYYDIVKERQARQAAQGEAGHSTFAIVRLEQLCPFPMGEIRALLQRPLYRSARRFIWAQEEPSNMGAYGHVAPRLSSLLCEILASRPAGEGAPTAPLQYVGRETAACPAVGYSKGHAEESKRLMADLFGAISA